MKIAKIAAQLYTLRDCLKTPAEIAVTLKRVRTLGYQSVQCSGLGPIDPGELKRILDGEGLSCCATHEGGDMILNQADAVISKLKALDCKITAYPYPAGYDFSQLDQVLLLAGKLNDAGRKFAAAGMILAYHNHSFEFQRLQGKTALEWIYEKTDPRFLQGEPDTYWVQHGGGDPAAWCRRLKGRLPVIHLKDYTVREKQPCFAPVGQGNLDMPAIIRAADEAGCEWYIVEQDDCYGASPFDCLAESYRYLAALAKV
jgi:sugar phosphate isomerase/epimerase